MRAGNDFWMRWEGEENSNHFLTGISRNVLDLIQFKFVLVADEK